MNFPKFLRTRIFTEHLWKTASEPLCVITDYLSAWIENQSRTPNDRCAFEHNISRIRTKRLNELIRTNTYKRKIYGFVQPLRTRGKTINKLTKPVILLSYIM